MRHRINNKRTDRLIIRVSACESNRILFYLGMVRDALAQQDRVPLVRFTITKLLVRPVKHVQHSIALTEPGEEDKNQPYSVCFWSLFTILNVSRNNSKQCWAHINSFPAIDRIFWFSLLYDRRCYYSSLERASNFWIKTQGRSRSTCKKV